MSSIESVGRKSVPRSHQPSLRRCSGMCKREEEVKSELVVYCIGPRVFEIEDRRPSDCTFSNGHHAGGLCS
jgi:hypothetical protein